ncbi:MAG: hypothetical protein AB1896_05950 [Thermodesulfobacteriota bacterium]
MKRLYLLMATTALFLVLNLPGAAEAAVFYSYDTGKCYEVVYEGVINKFWNIYRCRTCKCQKKDREAVGFETIDAAIDYLEKRYGKLEPR